MPEPKPVEPKPILNPMNLDQKGARKLLDVKRDSIKGITDDDENEHYRAGVLWLDVLENNLAVLAGFKSAIEFVNAEIKTIPQSSLSLYAGVAKVFPEAVASKFGMTKLSHVLTLRKLLNVELPPDPGAFELKITDKDGKVTKKKFADCSDGDLTRTIRAIKTPAAGLPAEVASEVTRLQGLLEGLLGEHCPATIRAHKHGAHYMLDLTNVPVESMSAVAQTLSE